ncbi:MAG TPA: thiamine pyrophosphate-binding protein [Streptosporangiales bacterium]
MTAERTPDSSRDPRYGSDVMADAINSMGFRFAAINPGASYRGLHDSLVNYTDNSPELIQCLHEEIAVGIAHGYAKATGEPMAAIVHDVVGLLHASMSIYIAHMDRVPVVVFGGGGPMAVEKRRPEIDWLHSANVQGNAVRDYTKWDDQPASVESVAQSVARAYRAAVSQPQGPVYVAFDAALQEEELHGPVSYPRFERLAPASRIGAEPARLRELAALLVEARHPVAVCGYAGRDPSSFHALVELSELLGMGVLDMHHRLNFPNRHPMSLGGADALAGADLVFFVDVKDTERATSRTDSTTRESISLVPDGATVVGMGFGDLTLSAWTQDFAALTEMDLEVTADSSVALPELVDLCRRLEAEQDPSRRDARVRHRAEVEKAHDDEWSSWQEQAESVWDQSPVSTARLAAEVWNVVQEYDWVLCPGTANEWAYRVWDFDKPYRHVGKTLGTGTQISISLGVALAHKGSGRLVVDLQPDGDLLFDPQALWTAAYHEIPMLVVMFNNRAYYNDWAHQERMARARGRAVENAYLGMELDKPAPDFAAIARAFGWYAEGPVEHGDDVGAAVRRAAEVVAGTGQPALVDVVCQPR